MFIYPKFKLLKEAHFRVWLLLKNLLWLKCRTYCDWNVEPTVTEKWLKCRTAIKVLFLCFKFEDIKCLFRSCNLCKGLNLFLRLRTTVRGISLAYRNETVPEMTELRGFKLLITPIHFDRPFEFEQPKFYCKTCNVG